MKVTRKLDFSTKKEFFLHNIGTIKLCNFDKNFLIKL